MSSESHCGIPAFEMTSLSNKFKNLWLAGVEGKLVFETHAGKAWVHLHVQLEQAQDGPLPQVQPHYPHGPKNSPSRQRRRARRKAARLEQAKRNAQNPNEEGETDGGSYNAEKAGRESVDNTGIAEEANRENTYETFSDAVIEETIAEDDSVNNIEIAEEAKKEKSFENLSDDVVGETIAADDPVPEPQNVISYECYFCDLDCVNEEILENHWYERHIDEFQHSESEESEKECEYHCQFCQSNFKNAGQLRRHKKRETLMNSCHIL